MKIIRCSTIRYILASVFIVLICTSCSADGLKTTSSKGYHKEGKVTIRFLSNLPERDSGQGKLEQLLIDNYMSENSNINIEVEAYQDEPYKQRFKAYAISDDLPDIFFVWGQPSFFYPVMKGGYASELDTNKFKKDEFKDGALEGFSLDGRLYGVPKSMDYMALYYNKDLFNKNGIDIPKNFKELIEVCKSFRDKGIIPITINIKDKWPLALLYQELVLMEGQDQNFIYDAIHGKESFIDNPLFKKAAEDLKLLIDACGIADTMTQLDYNTSMNLFTKKESAMIYTGSWEIGMVNNTELPEEFRNQMEVSKMPLVLESKANDAALVAWNGGGYAISSRSQVKDEAIKFLEYLMKPENWAKKGFEKGLIVPAQKYENYSNKKETKIQKELVSILNNSKSLSGTSWHDSLTPNFKLNIEELCYQLAAGRISPDYFLKEIDKEVKSENISNVK